MTDKSDDDGTDAVVCHHLSWHSIGLSASAVSVVVAKMITLTYCYTAVNQLAPAKAGE